MAVIINKVNNYVYNLTIDGETITVSPDIISGLTVEDLASLKFSLKQELARLSYELRKYEHQKKSLKVEIMNALRSESKMSKTEAESQVEVDERYKGLNETINLLKLQIDYLYNIISFVQDFMDIKKDALSKEEAVNGESL